MEEAELFDILIKGPGPYGFRLYGGEGDPLIVAKLRARSKAHDAGLREGDVVLGIKGRSCQSMSYGIAMALLESAGDALHLHLYRGSTAKASLLAAYQSLGSQLRPVSPGTVPPNRSIYAIQPTPEVQSPATSQPTAVQQPAVEPATAPATSSSRQQEVTSLDADVTQPITTETEEQDRGGVTSTKVTRQVVLETKTGGTTGSSSQEPARRDDDVIIQRATIFHVPKIKAQPLLWQPQNSGSALASERGGAADRILVNRPVTIEVSPFIGAGGKEYEAPRIKAFANVEPSREEPPRFKVQKTTAKSWVWQPGFLPGLPAREDSPALAFHAVETTPLPPPTETSSHENRLTIKTDESRKGKEELGEEGVEGLSDRLVLSPDLIRALTTEGPQEDWEAFKRKKKIFADSSFYDEPEHKYPTIEEQIKMARKLALSLSAPDNVTARGQRMFMKRKEKAKGWTSDDLSFEGHATMSFDLRPERTSTEAQDIYYNTSPWKTPTAKKVGKGTIDPRVKNFEGYPEESQASFVKNRALFERGLGHTSFRPEQYDRSGRKVSGSGSLPLRPSHGLTNDLSGMRGKGAQLFAKRRAKLAEEEQQEAEWDGWRSEGEAGLLRERSEKRAGLDYPDPIYHPQQASARGLEELVSISKAHLSPWESMAGRQVPKMPWQQKMEGKPWKGVATEDLLSTRSISEQATSEGYRPSFFGKLSSGVYRPVRFHVPSEFQLVPGVSEF